MSGVGPQEFDDGDIEHDPADLPHPDDTEDVAMKRLARRMARIMGIPPDELRPGLSRLVVAEQLRQEKPVAAPDKGCQRKSSAPTQTSLESRRTGASNTSQPGAIN